MAILMIFGGHFDQRSMAIWTIYTLLDSRLYMKSSENWSNNFREVNFQNFTHTYVQASKSALAVNGKR